VLDAARSIGVDIDSVCGGRGICGRCQVTPTIGTFPKWGLTVMAESLSPIGQVELEYTGARAIGPNSRLGCSVAILGDVVVDVPPESQIHKQVVRKAINLGKLQLDPIVTLHYLEPQPALLGGDETAAELIADALSMQLAAANVEVAPHVLPMLYGALSADTPGLTVAVRTEGVGATGGPTLTISAIWPGFVDSALGIAIDIGSTTVAGHLCNLATGEVLSTSGRMNPQIRFGEDLMSRVSYVMMNPGGQAQLTSSIRTAIDELIDELIGNLATEAAEPAIGSRLAANRSLVLELVLVGNPVMHHLLLGIDPTPLGAAPFLLATRDAIEIPARDLDLNCPNASVYIAPCIAGHVGADTAAVISAEGPHRSSTVQLLVDVGTNAEIVLGNSSQLFAASSPTGPAFEGAQISCGVRASAGAIERVRIDRSTLQPRFKIIGSDLWSDQPGFGDESAGLGIIGVCGSGIIEVVAEMFLAGILDADGVIHGASASAASTGPVVADGRTFSYVLAAETSTTPRLCITQNDVRAVQLAKAALRAGIDLLMGHAEVAELGDVRLAGAFGSHIDPVYAMVLGLLPDCPVESVRSSGNSAGAGAVRLLLSAQQRTEIESVVGSITKIETATEPRFQELFIAAMAFPHKTAPNPHLAAAIDLPERSLSPNPGARRRRRRKDSK